MTKRYRTTREAENDIIRLYLEGYERFGPNQADVYAAGLIAAIEMLAEHPTMVRERRELKPPVRIHRYGSHVIVYMIEDQGIAILRVRYGRENWSGDPLGRRNT
ncbi:type II toxin-antitoxin system RelE/ParE family toxin [Caulobacter sp. SLTY]|uniref:type II toxin-antitoxin system RelE/ParE family toxin n=1 Tax=Caulobacter sp. SLTY TaxID=2683262 RepID=UPI003211E05F